MAMAKKLIVRNTLTPEGRAFWESVERIAAQADDWPDSRKAGINVSPYRQDPVIISRYERVLWHTL